MTTFDKSALESQILGSSLDDTTKVRLFQILDRGASPSELFLISLTVGAGERHKKPHLSVDSQVRNEFNQP